MAGAREEEKREPTSRDSERNRVENASPTLAQERRKCQRGAQEKERRGAELPCLDPARPPLAPHGERAELWHLSIGPSCEGGTK